MLRDAKEITFVAVDWRLIDDKNEQRAQSKSTIFKIYDNHITTCYNHTTI
jgi:hypothetical protein